VVCCKTAGNAVPETMPENMGRSTVEVFNNPGYIGRKIVEGDALQQSLTAPDAAHIDGDDLQPLDARCCPNQSR
jgi:hypothetical protein